MSKTARVCAHIMLNGGNCRQVTLRDKLYCRHHVNGSRIHRRALHQRAMDRLRAEAKNLGTWDLLAHLSHRLYRIQSAVAGYPEARTLLSVVLERLRELELSGHDIDTHPALPPVPNPYLDADGNPDLAKIQDFLESLTRQ
jgi:hypothetical protein